MSDLVERLRETADMNIDWPPQPSLIRRAADEIERLQARVAELESDLAAKAELVEMLLAEKRASDVPNP